MRLGIRLGMRLEFRLLVALVIAIVVMSLVIAIFVIAIFVIVIFIVAIFSVVLVMIPVVVPVSGSMGRLAPMTPFGRNGGGRSPLTPVGRDARWLSTWGGGGIHCGRGGRRRSRSGGRNSGRWNWSCCGISSGSINYKRRWRAQGDDGNERRGADPVVDIRQLTGNAVDI